MNNMFLRLLFIILSLAAFWFFALLPAFEIFFKSSWADKAYAQSFLGLGITVFVWWRLCEAWSAWVFGSGWKHNTKR